MPERSTKKQRREPIESTHKTEFDAVTKSLAKLLKKPLLSLLGGAEPGEDAMELDRWWTLDGVSNVPAEKLQDISECFSTLAKLRKHALD
jgi:hypothetical protein